MKKMKYSKLLVCSLLLLSHQGVNAQLLKGVLKAPQKVETLQIAYSRGCTKQCLPGHHV